MPFSNKRWFAFGKSIYTGRAKNFGVALNAIQFLVWLKILGPVKKHFGKKLIGCKIRKNWGFVFRFLLKPSPDVVSSSKWKIFNGNEIGTLLAWWQLQVHYKKFGDQYQRKVKLITSSHDSWIYVSTNFVFKIFFVLFFY